MGYFWHDNGFLNDGVHEIPMEALSLTDEQHAALMTAQANGFLIVTGNDGRPVAVSPPPVEFNPGPDYEKRGDDWYKIRFTKKEFLLLCGLDKVAALNAGAKENPMLAAIHDILMASEFIDVTDQDTMQLVGLLASAAGGNILSTADSASILGGVKYVAET